LPAGIHQAQETGAVRNVEPSPIQLGMTLADVEKKYIQMTIASVGGNRVLAPGFVLKRDPNKLTECKPIVYCAGDLDLIGT
jgi:hypothetical protein